MGDFQATAGLMRATPEDARGLQDLARKSYEAYIQVINAVPVPMSADYAALIKAHEVWVIHSNGSPVASLVLVPHDDHLLIESVTVDPDEQGKGFGRIMLDWAELRAERLNLPELRLYTHVLMTWNRDWYKRAGFIETHEEQRGDKLIVHMRKMI